MNNIFNAFQEIKEIVTNEYRNSFMKYNVIAVQQYQTQ